jgi:hypothetical protein
MKKTTARSAIADSPGNWRCSIGNCVKNSREIHSHEIFFCHRLPDLGTPARPTRGHEISAESCFESGDECGSGRLSRLIMPVVYRFPDRAFFGGIRSFGSIAGKRVRALRRCAPRRASRLISQMRPLPVISSCAFRPPLTRAKHDDWSGRADLNRGPPAPKAGALPGCATPRLREGLFDYSRALCRCCLPCEV